MLKPTIDCVGRGVRAPAPYLRRLSSNRTLSDDSDTASSKDAELTSVSSSSPSDDFIKSGFHEENDRVEQASAVTLRSCVVLSLVQRRYKNVLIWMGVEEIEILDFLKAFN